MIRLTGWQAEKLAVFKFTIVKEPLLSPAPIVFLRRIWLRFPHAKEF